MKLFSVILFLFIGCSSSKDVIDNSVSKSNNNQVVFEQLVQSSIGGYVHPQIKVIKEQKELEETFNYVNKSRKPGFPIPDKINFSRETIVAIFMGQKNTGGYSVSVAKVEEQENKIKIFVTEESPGKNDMVTMAITQPFCIVKVNNADKEFVFEKYN